MKFGNDFDYWMGWVVAALISALSIGALASFMFLSDSFCTGEQSEHCLREWVSATGTWAAIPAAAVTVIFLFRQVHRADIHHRQSIRVMIDKKYTMAANLIESWEGVEEMVDDVDITCSFWEADQENGAPDMSYPNIHRTLRIVRKHIGQKIFDVIDDEFFYEGENTVDDIRQRLSVVPPEATDWMKSEFYNPHWVRESTEMIRAQYRSMAQAAKSYVAEVEKMLS